MRIGAYFHDVGKLHAPHMFVENLRGAPNPHEGLDPVESARIIIRHVSYGIERAEAAGLPPQLRELITGHHGTRTLHFFLEKARRQAPEGAEVDESLCTQPPVHPARAATPDLFRGGVQRGDRVVEIGVGQCPAQP